MDTLSQIARTVLYEGYVLWPYRRSAIKNQQRWTFGGIYPVAFAASSGGADRSAVRTECLIEAAHGTRVDVSLRFLHVMSRQVMRVEDDRRVPVSELEIDGTRYLSWDEATERDVATTVLLPDSDTQRSTRLPIRIEPGEIVEQLGVESGAAISGDRGLIARSWQRLDGTMEIELSPLSEYAPRSVYRVAVTVTNDSPWHGEVAERADAIRHTFTSAHVALHADGGAFISAEDPPPPFADDVRRCRNEGLWPVLVGDDGTCDTMLASPIILGDYPRIAPESPGDLFDGGEIDQLLILNILTLTDEEQREMRDSDPRGREILERCTALSEEELTRLHGTVRALRPFTRTEESSERHLV